MEKRCGSPKCCVRGGPQAAFTSVQVRFPGKRNMHIDDTCHQIHSVWCLLTFWTKLYKNVLVMLLLSIYLVCVWAVLSSSNFGSLLWQEGRVSFPIKHCQRASPWEFSDLYWVPGNFSPRAEMGHDVRRLCLHTYVMYTQPSFCFQDATHADTVDCKCGIIMGNSVKRSPSLGPW